MKHIHLFLIFSVLLATFACNTQNQNETTELAVPVSVEDIRLQPIKKIYKHHWFC